jgi:patatin-like phospholipase/acyl hydrolase
MNSYPINSFSKDQTVRILSLDGGGIRGISEAMMMAEVEKRTNKKATELFDIIAGVSIGSLIGAGLVTKFAASDMVTLWENKAQEIFKCNAARVVTTADGTLAPKWPYDNYIKLVGDTFGNFLLSDSTTEFICPAKETTKDENWYFSRNTARLHPEFSKITIQDCILSSSAAPGFFRSHPLKIAGDELNFIDGAMFAPNPTDVALSSAGNPENTLVLSLGTGRKLLKQSYKQTAQRGFLGWAVGGQLFEMMIESNAQNIHQSMKSFLKEKYFRWETTLDKDVRLDDAASLPYLKELTNTYISVNDKQIQKTCDAFAAVSNR